MTAALNDIKIQPIEINHFCTHVCCNTLYPKASDYLHNKEEIDLHSNLVTESKVTECNRIRTILTQKSMSHDEIKKSQSLLFNNVCAILMSGYIPCISGECSGQVVWRSPVQSSCRACDIDFCARIVRLIRLHSVTFDSVTKLLCKSIISLLYR